ncbi:MAG: MBL fold metallo-hydrolase [Verrucomicrobiota bacterium]|nr:MBL fold metallo-hydrolase [Verrucomicrobiota bacterium]
MKRLLLTLVVSILFAALVQADEKRTIDIPNDPVVTVKWFGQSFIYLTTSTGVRIAIDPFDNKTSSYTLPEGEPVDVLLVSNEGSDHNNTDIFSGSPLIFRSGTGEGTNRGNGILFRGVSAFQDDENGRFKGRTTVFAFDLDDLRFVHLGALGQTKLSSSQLEQIGKVDVVFVPVGLGDFKKVVAQLKPRIIIPIHYKTPYTSASYYPLDEFIEGKKVVRSTNNVLKVHRDQIPAQQEVWIFNTPVPVPKKAK